jgi:hypothetical protein
MKTKQRVKIRAKERRRHRLSLQDVALRYRGGSSRERIRQIEAGISVSSAVERDYRSAIAAAIQARLKSAALLQSFLAAQRAAGSRFPRAV